jgi:hypothetical protein
MSDLFLNSFENTSTSSNTQVVDQFGGDDFLSPTLKVKPLLEQINWVLTHRKSEYVPALIRLKNNKSVQIKRKTATAICSIRFQRNHYRLAIMATTRV